MGHIYRQLTEAECAEEIRAICGDDPGNVPEERKADREPQPPAQGELL